MRKRFYVVCICADDWRSNSKCVGKYSIASSNKGGWRNENYALDNKGSVRTHRRDFRRVVPCLPRVESVWVRETVRETIEEDIRTYKCEVEKMNEKVENLIAQLNNHV